MDDTGRELRFVGVTMVQVDSALGMLAPDGEWQGMHLYRRSHLPLPAPDERGVYRYPPRQGYDGRPGTLVLPAPPSLWYDVSVDNLPRAIINVYDLPDGIHVRLRDGYHGYNGRAAPAIGEPFTALGDALAGLLGGQRAGDGGSLPVEPAGRRRGLTDKVRKRGELYVRIKTETPQLSRKQVAKVANMREARELERDKLGPHTENTVRHACRAIGYDWPDAREIR